MDDYTIKPGDYFLTQISGFGGTLIRIAQAFAGDASRYTHAGIFLDDGTIIEAMPGGARIVSNEATLRRRPLAISQFDIDEDARARIVEIARGYKGVPYNFADYLTIGLDSIGIRPKWLRNKIHSSKSMICSQLVDKIYSVAGVKLFDDGRDPGDVTPGDLAHVGTIFHVTKTPIETR